MLQSYSEEDDFLFFLSEKEIKTKISLLEKEIKKRIVNRVQKETKGRVVNLLNDFINNNKK